MTQLSEAGTATQQELRSRLTLSRTTVSRSLRSLEERGWVTHEDGAYRLTQAGSIIINEFSNMLATIRNVEALTDFLRWFPTDESTPDFLDAGDVALTVSSDGDPYAPAREQTEILKTADRIKILLPSVDLEGTKMITEQVTQHGLQAETVADPKLEETFTSRRFRPLLREKIETGSSDVLIASEPIPFYLSVTGDGRVQIGVEDDEGFPRSLLETTDEDIREWAENVYREYRKSAKEKSAEEFH